MRVTIILIILSVLSSQSFASAPKAPMTILFGSCAHQDKDMPILDAIANRQRDLFIFLGDNIYGDSIKPTVLAKKYKKLANKARFKRVLDKPVVAIWDDHDYGANDAGSEYFSKHASRKLMLDFWGEPKSSPRRSREDGIYTSYVVGQGQQAVRIILPDLRWNRPALHRVSNIDYVTKRRPAHQGPYEISPDIGSSMLGEQQWRWLEKQLSAKEPIKVIASSLQVLAEFTGWEAWANYPVDRDRLLKYIRQEKVNGVLIVSGDTHWGELSKLEHNLDYPLWEVTSSGLTEEWKNVSPNRHRVGSATSDVNFGELIVDWGRADPAITFGLRDEKGKVVFQHRFSLSSISPYKSGLSR